MARSSRTPVDLGAMPRAELEAQFAIATRGAQMSPLPERLCDVSDPELADLTQRLARRQHECGCSAGAWAMCAAAVIAAVGGLVRGASTITGALALAALGIGFVLVSTIAVKFSAIGIGHLRWRHDRDAVVARLATSKGAGHVVVR